ncbi:hypothetical protein ACUIG4_04100 [Raoultella ornithinolytica]|uniref:hypothetical protein n=1 Tax=Raoultella ornithinolytica TaxID=54291 RepID=UPI00403D73EC
MKNLSAIAALFLAASLSSAAIAAEHRPAQPEAGSNMDTSVHQNRINVSHAFDKESLTAGNLQ